MTSFVDGKTLPAQGDAIRFTADVKLGEELLLSAARHDEKEGWTFYSEISDSIKVYTRENPEGGPQMVCGCGIIEVSPERVLAEVSSVECWKQWDPLLKDVEIVRLDDSHRICHLLMHRVWPYQARDVVYIELYKQLEDGTRYLATRGVKCDEFPEKPDEYVRVILKGGGWHLAPVPGEHKRTLATYFMNCDPQLALIPTWLYNWALTRFPSIINKVRDGVASNHARPVGAKSS